MVKTLVKFSSYHKMAIWVVHQKLEIGQQVVDQFQKTTNSSLFLFHLPYLLPLPLHIMKCLETAMLEDGAILGIGG